MLNKLTIILLLVLPAVVYGQTSWKTTSAEVNFTIKNAGITVNGGFSGFTADVLFSGDQLTKSKITASVTTNSIHTGIETRDKHLKKEDYFNASVYPTITMQSKFFVAADDGTYRGYFKLILKGTTKDVMIPFKFDEKGNTGILSGKFSLNRLDYGIGESSLVLSNEVIVNINVNLEKL